jgi:ubiquinone/menaquinone biosynthesis C-methylase UbiE
MRARLARPILLLVGLACVGAIASAQVADDSREKSEKVADILAALQAAPGKQIADLGAGEGFYSLRIARAVGPNGRVLAVDISDAYLQKLRTRVRDDQISNVDIIVGAVDDPRLPTGTLDSVLIYTRTTR